MLGMLEDDVDFENLVDDDDVEEDVDDDDDDDVNEGKEELGEEGDATDLEDEILTLEADGDIEAGVTDATPADQNAVGKKLDWRCRSRGDRCYTDVEAVVADAGYEQLE